MPLCWGGPAGCCCRRAGREAGVGCCLFPGPWDGFQSPCCLRRHFLGTEYIFPRALPQKSSFMLCYRFFPASSLTFSTHPQVCLKTVHFGRVPPELHRGQRALTRGWCWLPRTTECTAGLPRNISGCARHCGSSSSASTWLSKAKLLRSEGRQE